MKRFIPVAVIVAGALAFVSFAAVKLNGADANVESTAAPPLSQPLPPSIVTDAATTDSPSVRGVPQTNLKGAYVGVALAALTEDEAKDLGIEDGAVVKSVLQDSPADGLLEEEDIITSVDGESVSGPREVVDAVRSSSPDDVMTFTVLRNGDTMDVQLTLGEREAALFAFRGFDAYPGHGLNGPFHGARDRVVRSEFVTETDDGFETTRTLVGTLENVDVDAGTFDIVPADGTATVHFEVDEETRVSINHDGDLSGLSTGERAYVVEVETADGDRVVKLVSQGGRARHIGPRGNFNGRVFGSPGLRFRGSHDGQSYVEIHPGQFPEIRERLRSFLRDDTLQDLKERRFEFEHFFDQAPKGPGDSQ